MGLLAVCLIIALFLFQLLGAAAIAMVDGILAAREAALTDAQRVALDNGVFNLSLLVSVAFFVILFLFLLGERLSYIRDIIKGIDALRGGQMDHRVPLEMNNELTRLAEAVNYLSATQRQVQERERALGEEREQLIRTLSHDIRTPLTSILAYSEFQLAHADCPAGERRERLALIKAKAEQIKELTDILLDGGRRNLERFEDARMLMEQLAAEFEEELEEDFRMAVDLTGCPPFSGAFDVGELRRIFDNLSSNIRKYADPSRPVTLSIRMEEGRLVICQGNAPRLCQEGGAGHQIGLNSIRRIAHSYGGRVAVRQEEGAFEITVTLSEF